MKLFHWKIEEKFTMATERRDRSVKTLFAITPTSHFLDYAIFPTSPHFLKLRDGPTSQETAIYANLETRERSKKAIFAQNFQTQRLRTTDRSQTKQGE